jgi:membrane-associated protein
MLEDYISLISNFIIKYGYIVVFSGLFLENTILLGLLFPGITILLISGYFSGTGELNVALTIISGFAGTILGDNLNYALGRYGLVKLPILKKLSSGLDRIEEAIRRNTTIFLIFFHFPVYSRMVLPAFLGILRFSFRKWLIFDTIGALLFTSTFVLIGYVIGRTSQALDVAVNASNYIQWFFIAVLIWWTITTILEIRKFIRNKPQ